MYAKFSKKKLLPLLQLIVISGTFIYIFRIINWSEAAKIVKHANLNWVGLALLSAFLAFIPLAKRYSYLLQASKVHYSFWMSYTAYLSSTFVNLAMPGVLGSDLLRIFYCKRDSSATIVLASAIIFTERMLGLVALVVLISFSSNTMRATASQYTNIFGVLAILSVAAIALVPGLLGYLAKVHLSTKNRIINIIFDKINHLGAKLTSLTTINVFHLYVGLCLSIFAQLIDVFTTYSLSQALDFNLNLQILMLVVPITYLLIILPISPGGIGIREGAFVFTLTWFNVPASEAALLALAVFFSRVVVGLLGGIILLNSRKKVREFKNSWEPNTPDLGL